MKYVKTKKTKGLTLIEVVIYLALTSLIMTACITTIFYSIDSSKKNESRLYALDEINFLNQKIFWVVTHSTAGYDPTLEFNKINYNAEFLFKHYIQNSHEYIEWSVLVNDMKSASTTVKIKP